MTIFAILAALVSRLWAYAGNCGSTNNEESFAEPSSADNSDSHSSSDRAFFFARFFLASIAPMLFARLLFLSQIDPVLGPMTQVRLTCVNALEVWSFDREDIVLNVVRVTCMSEW